MRFTFGYETSERRYQTQISSRKIVSVIILSSLLFLISSRSTQIPSENAAQVALVKHGLLAQQTMLEGILAEHRENEDALVTEIAHLQAQLQLMALQQAHIAEQLDVSLSDTHIESPELLLTGSLSESVEHIQTRLEYQIKQLNILENVYNNTHIDTQQRITGRPIQSGWLSSYYGMRDDPFTGKPAMHKGIDFAGKAGDPVIATAAGVITWSGERFGYGNLVEIDHGNGLVTRYGHNHTLNVMAGEVVTKGQQIATIGNTGRSTGAHVHYEVIKHGKQIDPLPFVYRK